MAFQKMFTTSNASPSCLWTDKGTAFCNQQLNSVLTANNVTLYSTENDDKTSVVERWNRTMWMYFTGNNTQTYRDVLPSMVERYNNTYQSIKLNPTDTRKPANYKDINNALYAKVNIYIYIYIYIIYIYIYIYIYIITLWKHRTNTIHGIQKQNQQGLATE